MQMQHRIGLVLHSLPSGFNSFKAWSLRKFAIGLAVWFNPRSDAIGDAEMITVEGIRAAVVATVGSHWAPKASCTPTH